MTGVNFHDGGKFHFDARKQSHGNIRVGDDDGAPVHMCVCSAFLSVSALIFMRETRPQQTRFVILQKQAAFISGRAQRLFPPGSKLSAISSLQNTHRDMYTQREQMMFLTGCIGWNKFIRRVSFPLGSSISLRTARNWITTAQRESQMRARCGRLAMCAALTGANRIRDLWKMELRVWTFVHLGRPFCWIDRHHCEWINCTYCSDAARKMVRTSQAT